MRFAYYPGCSLEATGRAYDESSRALAGPLGIELEELEDWNCCGATTYMSVRELMAFSFSARNLSLAQQRGLDIVAPCSACFTVLRKTDHYLREMPELRAKVSRVLEAAGLAYDPGSVRVRHLLEVMLQNGGMERIRERVRAPLSGLRVAPYYGCQIVRPRVDFDTPELPTTLDNLLKVLGADVVYYPVKTRCCGASLVASNEPAAVRLCKNLLLCAQQSGADCIVTLCPLCQMNLDGFQQKVNATYGTNFRTPVLYFTQLTALAMGLSPRALGLGRGIVDARPLLSRYGEIREAPAAGRGAAVGVGNG
jgi:heterodisulfide reductase subunit B